MKGLILINLLKSIFCKKKKSVDYSEINKNGLSDFAYDLILKYEVGSKSYYEKSLKKPTYPGGASGVTIGIGYDLGYNSKTSFKKDWGAYLSDSDYAALEGTLGLKRDSAKKALLKVKHISIDWNTAFAVFKGSTVPKFIAQTLKSFPGSEKLHPDAFGALVSLVFNRGGSTKGSTRKEMKNIADALSGAIPTDNIYDYIADQIVGMKRLWVGKGLDGLLKRRDAEAAVIRGVKNK